ncbi:FxSxx-COOH system tetratricopeptide repeat protein [Paractinoplanes durhamensis]|uniref:FxSxx-COOH system tetratricopeptide repeat protein n=1 Tax=Paractinoplanes durhamensis TaxID=113563 RepID=UPI0036303102
MLITSRNPAWGDQAQILQVDVFSRQESITHLRQRLPAIWPQEADRIADLLGDLPIAIAAAGAWLAETGEPVGEYVSRVEQQGPSLSTEQVWDYSLELLRERSPAAYRLLQLCACMAPDIPLDLVRGDEMADLLRDLDPAVTERAYRGVLVQHINRLALLKMDVSYGRIQVHRLIQHVVRMRMTQEELATTRHQVHLMLAASRPRYEVDDARSWPRFQMLWPHLEVSDAAECDDESVRQLLIDRVRYSFVTGDLAEGLARGRRIEQWWSRMLGDEEPAGPDRGLRRQLMYLRFNIANIIRQMGDIESARALDEQNLAEQSELLGPSHPHTLMSAGSLGADFRALGRYEDALARDERAYQTWVVNFGEDYDRTLSALNNLSSTYRLAGDFRSARVRDQDVYDRRRVMLGQTHPSTLSAGSNLGRDLRDAGQYRASVDLLEVISRQHEEVFGPRSYRTLSVRASLAVSVGCAGEVNRAAVLLEETYEQLNDIAGPARPDTLACRLSRAVILLAVGEVTSSVSELEELRRAYESSLGARHPHTLVCLNNLVVAGRIAAEPSDAVPRAGAVLSSMTDVLGKHHPYTLAAQLNLAIVHADNGDPEKGLELIESALAGHRDNIGPDHPDTLRCMVDRLLMRMAAGRESLADDGDAVQRLTAVLGADHPELVAQREGRYLARMLDPHPY